ncbi:MAG TPA: GAP family protein [Euzebyales bacterium]|nr:GAP family protein [Euzebyales bacterium]
MHAAIGQALPLAIGVALSPVAIIAVVVMLATSRARSNGPAFVLGWLLGVGVVGAVVLVLVADDAAGQRQLADRLRWLELVLGIALLIVAARQYRARPREGDEAAALPQWIVALDRLGPVQALGGGVALVGANPKNLLLSVGGAASIAATGIPGDQQALAYAVFAVAAAVGVAAPVVVSLAIGERSVEVLGHLRDWIGRNATVVVVTLCLVVAAKLLHAAFVGFAP